MFVYRNRNTKQTVERSARVPRLDRLDNWELVSEPAPEPAEKPKPRPRTKKNDE